MKRTLRMLLLCAASATAACGDGASEPKVQPGQLAVVLSTPHATDRALLLEIRGPALATDVQAVDAQTLVFAAADGSSTRVMVVGAITSGELLRVHVSDINRIDAYSVMTVEAADERNHLRADLSGYSTTLRALR